jgi:dolichol-phosphate mannosyltransferase
MLPTYNEAENIESLIQEIEELDLDLSIAVVDDSSPDGTEQVIRKLQKRYGNIHLISRPEKLGLGTAITAGFRWMTRLERQPDHIITMDADYSHNPEDIPRLIEAAKRGYDLVIGSRYCKGGRILGSNFRRRLISRLANFIAAATISRIAHDYTSGFRCYSKDYVRTVLPNLHSETYEIQIETLKQARLRGFGIEEVPITFVNRKRGKSKLSATEAQGFLTYIARAALSYLSQSQSSHRNK